MCTDSSVVGSVISKQFTVVEVGVALIRVNCFWPPLVLFYKCIGVRGFKAIGG